MTIEAGEISKSPEEINTDAVFEAKERVARALRQNPDYVRQEDETRFELGSMPTPITFSPATGISYEERVFRRTSQTAADGSLRNHEDRLLARAFAEGRTALQFKTTTVRGGSDRLGDIWLFVDGKVLRGQDAIDNLPISFPELFRPSE